MAGGWAGPPAQPAAPRTAAVVFAPEAHLPRERRLVVDGTGLTLETALGVRHLFPWHACSVVMVWPDRAELVLDDDVSLVVRARDWHHGDRAVAAIRGYAPQAAVLGMPTDPEPATDGYVLRGLATSSSAVLAVLGLALLLVAVIGVGVGIQDRRAVAVVIGLGFGAGCVGTWRALHRRLRVPSRWRDRAAVRGRMSVGFDSAVAAATDRRLQAVEWTLYAAAAVVVGLLVSGTLGFWPAPIPFLVAALRIGVERQRRRGRG